MLKNRSSECWKQILMSWTYTISLRETICLVRNNIGYTAYAKPIVIFIMLIGKEGFDGPKYKIILVGDSEVGKTSIFWRYIHNELDAEHPATTIDFRYKMISLHDRLVKLCIWDTAGQEKFRSIVATYFKSCQGVVLVFDLSNRQSWENVQNVWYQLAIKRVPYANYLLLGNKKDLERCVPLEEIHKWCQSKGIYFIETCALTGQSIEQAFFTLAALIDRQQQTMAKSSFCVSTNQYISETTKECTKAGTQRTSSMAVYRQQRTASFFLKRDTKLKNTQKQKCCR